MKVLAHGCVELVGAAQRRLAEQELLARQFCADPSENVLHALRIETRRMLATLAVLSPALSPEAVAAGRKFLKRQLKTTSRLRDLQVQRGLVGELALRRPVLRPLTRELVRKEQRVAAKTVARLRRPRDPERRRTLSDALRALEKDLREDRVALDPRPALQRAFVRIDRLRRGANDDPDQLHRLRLALKRYRYMREVVLAEPGSFTALRRAQKCLGELHDFGLLEQRIRKFAPRPPNPKWSACLRLLARRQATRLRRQRQLVAAICPPHGRAEKAPAAAGQIRPSKTQALRSGGSRLQVVC